MFPSWGFGYLKLIHIRWNFGSNGRVTMRYTGFVMILVVPFRLRNGCSTKSASWIRKSALRNPVSKISAFVVAYNREHLIQAVLKRLSFADEIVVVDKSSTDRTVRHAHKYTDRVFVVPWTPTVEETRQFALERCKHDWIVALDDDEILTEPCGDIFRSFIAGVPQADILEIPMRHYILGRFDERACYWPEYRPTLSKRGALRYSGTVHAGVEKTGTLAQLPLDSPAHIMHLSHPDVHTWIEKTNRYTDQVNRSGTDVPADIVTFAKLAIDGWTRGQKDQYLQAVGVCKALYEIVDALKRWEATQPDGNLEFARLASEVIGGTH